LEVIGRRLCVARCEVGDRLLRTVRDGLSDLWANRVRALSGDDVIHHLGQGVRIEGKVVVVEGASVVVGATVVVVTGGFFDPRANAIPMPPSITTSTRMAITRALRTFVVCFGAVLGAIGEARGALMEVSPSCPPRILPGSPTIVVMSLDGVDRTQGSGRPVSRASSTRRAH